MKAKVGFSRSYLKTGKLVQSCEAPVGQESSAGQPQLAGKVKDMELSISSGDSGEASKAPCRPAREGL